MSDRTLGKLLRKSRSLRRGRTGSVDAAADRDGDGSSVGSDSATVSLSRSRRSSIRRSHTSDVLGDSHADDGPTSPVVVYHVSADKEAQDEDPSLTSCDSEDTEL